jgi:hypothetical protein
MAGSSQVLLPSPNQQVQQIRHVVLASKTLPTDVTRLTAAHEWEAHMSTKFPSVSIPLVHPVLPSDDPHHPDGSIGGTACILMPGPVNVAGIKATVPGGLSAAVLEVFVAVLTLTLENQMTEMPATGTERHDYREQHTVKNAQLRRQAIFGSAPGANTTNGAFPGYIDGDGGSHTSASESYSEVDDDDDNDDGDGGGGKVLSRSLDIMMDF